MAIGAAVYDVVRSTSDIQFLNGGVVDVVCGGFVAYWSFVLQGLSGWYV